VGGGLDVFQPGRLVEIAVRHDPRLAGDPQRILGKFLGSKMPASVTLG
jgi:hypothetical protein